MDIKRDLFTLYLTTLQSDHVFATQEKPVGYYIGLEAAQDRAIALMARNMPDVVGFRIEPTCKPRTLPGA